MSQQKSSRIICEGEYIMEFLFQGWKGIRYGGRMNTMITLKFEKTYQRERKGEPSFIAVPVPKGKIFETNKVLVSRDGKIYPSQAKITSKWEDGSIRWLFVRFLVNLPGNDKSEYYLSYRGEVVGKGYDAKGKRIVAEREIEIGSWEYKKLLTNSPIISCVTEGSGFRIDNGTICFIIESGENSNFKYGNFNGATYNSGNFYGPVLTDAMGQAGSLKTVEWHVIEEGPVCIILAGEGYHQLGNQKYKVESKLKIFAGIPAIDVSYRIFNTSDEPLVIKSLIYGFRAPECAKRTCVASSNYKTDFEVGENGEPLERLIDAEHLLFEANEHLSEVFYGTLFADCTTARGGICATIYQPQQNYPKAVSADESGLRVHLVPEGATEVVMQPGMAREQKFLMHFHEPELELKDINHISLIYQMPDRPVVEPSVFEESGAVYPVFVSQKKPEVEIAFIHKADSHARCFGMLNWGDSPDPGYTTQGRGGGEPVWTNNEYDFPHACALMYARTGTRRFFDYLLVAGRHWMDVDICHYSNNPLLKDGQWEHTRGHVIGGKIVCSHQWVEGLLDYYHFTGDEEALRTALGIGENILRLLDTPMFRQKGEINARETGWAMRSLTALYTETQEVRWLDKCDWIVGHFEEWEKEYGHWLSPYTDNTTIRVVFMISIAVGSLMRYYRIRPQEKIKAMILRAVDDLIENSYMDYGLFYYKELPSLSRLGNNTIVLEALAIAYELTGKKDYLSYGIMTFKTAIEKEGGTLGGDKKIVGDSLISAGSGTKNFAQSFLPLVTYYRDATECGFL